MRFSRLQDDAACLRLPLHLLFEKLRVRFNQRPGVVVIGDHLAGFQKRSGDDSVIDTHGVVIADRQESQVERIQLPDQPHIAKEAGVAGKIDLLAAVFNQETAGVTPGNAGAVEGQGRLDRSESCLLYTSRCV